MSDSEVKVVVPAAELARRVAELGQELSQGLADEDPILLGLLSGAEIFLADLVRAVARPWRFELVHVTYGRGETGGPDSLSIHFPIPVDVRNQHVLVIKDVVASGVTESYLVSQLRERGAASVRFVALVDLEDERKTPFGPDYRAFTLQRAGRLVGYGLKGSLGRLGNLPYLGEVPRT